MLRHLKNRELYLVAGAQGIQFLGTLVLIKLLSRWLTVGDFGLYSLSTSLIALFVLLPFNPFGMAILRQLSIYRDRGKLADFVSGSLGIHLAIGGAYLALALGVSLLPVCPPEWKILLPWVAAMLAIEAVKNLMISIGNAERARGVTVTISATEFGLKGALVAVLALSHHLNAVSAIQALCAASFLASWVGCWAYRKQIALSRMRASTIAPLLTGFWSFAAPLFIAGICEWLKSMSSRWVISHWLATDKVAYFSILSSLATFPATGLHMVIGTFSLPVIYERENQNPGYARATMFRLMKAVVLLQLAVVAVVAIFSTEFISIIADRKYALEAAWLPAMLASAFFQNLTMISTFELYAQQKTKILIWAQTLPGILSLGFSIALVPKLGVPGAFLTFIAGNVLQGAWVLATTLPNRSD